MIHLWLALSLLPALWALYLVAWRYRLDNSTKGYTRVKARKGFVLGMVLVATALTGAYGYFLSTVLLAEAPTGHGDIVFSQFLGTSALAGWCHLLTRAHDLYYTDSVLYWNGLPYFWSWYQSCELKRVWGNFIKKLHFAPRPRSVWWLYPISHQIWLWTFPALERHITTMDEHIQARI